MENIRDMKLSDFEYNYSNVINNKYDGIYAGFNNSYETALDYFKRMRDALSLGYNYIFSETDKVALSISDNTHAIELETRSTLEGLITYTNELYSTNHQVYGDSNLTVLMKQVTDEIELMESRAAYFQAKLDAMNQEKNSFLIQSNSLDYSGCEFHLVIDDMVVCLEKEISKLLESVALHKAFAHHLDDVNKCMLEFVSVSELWMNDYAQYTIYTQDNADVSKLAELIREQKVYLSYFAS